MIKLRTVAYQYAPRFVDSGRALRDPSARRQRVAAIFL